MSVRDRYGARRYNEPIMLTLSTIVTDDYGHASLSEFVDVLQVYASVRQMSAQKTLATFQQVDVIGIEVEFRKPNVIFNGIRYKGHDVQFAPPEDDGRILRLSGYYQKDWPEEIKAYGSAYGNDFA